MQYLNTESRGPVKYIRLNRPEKYNAMIREMALELQKTLHLYSDDDETRCIVLTGEGKAFCAGQDLREAVSGDYRISTIVKQHFNPIIQLLREHPIPVVAAVNGVAAGAGANIAFACDITVAREDAEFVQAFSEIGLIPDSGGTWLLPRLVGHQRAMQLACLGEKISAKEARDMGLISKVYSVDEFVEKTDQLAQKIGSMPTTALSLTKKAFNESWENDLNTQLALEAQLQTRASECDDYEEGVNAFLEKRKPNFKGR